MHNSRPYFFIVPSPFSSYILRAPIFSHSRTPILFLNPVATTRLHNHPDLVDLDAVREPAIRDREPGSLAGSEIPDRLPAVADQRLA